MCARMIVRAESMRDRMKKTVVSVVAFCAAVLVLLGVWHSTRPEAQTGVKSITVEVVHKDGSETSFAYETDLEYLGELLKREGLISGTEGQYGIFVDTVDGEAAVWEVDGGWWSLACNGEDAQTGVDDVVIEDGSVYTWTYRNG